MTLDTLIDDLAQDAGPVRHLSLTRGRIVALAASALFVAAFLALLGLRPDLAAGRPAPLILLVAGLFALTAVAAGWAATRLARPAVGSGNQTGAFWLLGAILLLPAVSFVEALLGNGISMDQGFGVRCLGWGLVASIITATALTHFLRRGAPVLPEKAGTLAGLSAGSIGALAVTLECSGTALSHLALWHVAVVALWTLAGRFALSRLLRW